MLLQLDSTSSTFLISIESNEVALCLAVISNALKQLQKLKTLYNNTLAYD